MGITKAPQTKKDSRLKTCPIAIIGISGIFPNSANKDEYWNTILNKIDAISDVPESRWSIDDYYDPDPKAEDKSYCKRGGFIPDIDFDPSEFGLPPNILEATDVSQLLSLAVARDCLEDAGYGDESKHSRENVGVILGMVGIGSKLVVPLMARLQYPVWDKVLKSYGISDEDRTGIIDKFKLAYPRWEENSFPGSIGNVVAGRIANRFNLGGTNCVIDAACASSLAAVRMAAAELIEGRADMMITGGVDTDNSIGAYLCFSKTPAFSRGDRVRSFDQESDGMMVGEGIGMILLKRLDDAERDGDRVYAVIKGIGTSSDGRYKSIYAPRADGQSLALKRAYIEAGFEPSTVGLIEAHGTGTVAGDPAEFQGLNTYFSEKDTQKQHIALGSVKSQIAHTKAAAGVASLIKVALALHHKVLPATINVKKPSEKLAVENSPFYINTEIRPWFRVNGVPRRAGVSSFGFGGTNFHVVMEEFKDDHEKPYRVQRTSKIVVISARTPQELLNNLRMWTEKLNTAEASLNFRELTSNASELSLPDDHCRVGFIAQDVQEASKKLSIAEELVRTKGNEEAAENPAGVYFRKQGFDTKGNVVALFPGQGSQYLNMGVELACNFPEIRQAFSGINNLYSKDGQAPITEILYPIPVFDDASREKQNKKLTQTEFAQPAIGAMSVALFKLLSKAGVKPDFSAGHSFGELTALWASRTISEEDFYFLARSRGKAMAPPPNPEFEAGTMLAVKGDVDAIKKELDSHPDVTLANWNSHTQVVLAGTKSAISAIQKSLTDKGFSVVALDVSAAFHTSLVGHAQKPFASAIEKANFKVPEIRVYSNTTGDIYPKNIEEIKEKLAGHIINPVLFKDEIESIYRDGGRIFIEIGPKNVLTNLVNNILDGKPHIAISLNPNAKKNSDLQFREAVLQLKLLGMDIHSFDTYAIETRLSDKKKSPIAVKLNGGLYLSEKTKNAFKTAIQSKNELHGFEIPVTNPPISIESGISMSSEKLVRDIKVESDDSLFSKVKGIQEDVSRIHEKFLSNDAEFFRVFSDLTAQELSLLKSGKSQQELEQINTSLQILDRSLSQFHQHQTETTRLHEQYINNQNDLLSGLVNLATGATTSPGTGKSEKQDTNSVPVNLNLRVEEPAKKTTPQIVRDQLISATPIRKETNSFTSDEKVQYINRDDLNSTLLGIVSEKTGYPVEMLELSMDMEADLGIDSIKRVEILAAMQENYPDLPAVDPAVLSDMHTLGQIIDYMSNSPEPSPITQTDVITHISKVAQPETAKVNSVPVISIDQMKQALLEIVSEKTGYPVEMLELNMDMEADLGIDSIKRVEILGGMQERFPELPPFEPASLSEMRTLKQIIDQISLDRAKISKLDSEQQSESELESSKEPLPETSETVASQEVLSESLMAVVSEKTGYPVEMLEPEMDMEADLGIDSIKRVEIMGAMQEKFPDLPSIDSSHLSEMRTLQQIINAFSNKMIAGDSNSSVQIMEEIKKDQNQLSKAFINIKSIPYPDRLEINLPDDSFVLVTDDGSNLTVDVAQNLISDGKKVVVIKHPDIEVTRDLSLPEKTGYYQLTDTTEETINALLSEIKTGFGHPASFIHLDPVKNGKDNFSISEQKIVKTIFLLAKLLKADLEYSVTRGYASFITITRLDGKFGLSMTGSLEPISGGLFGLTKTLNLEWDEVYCRAVDIQADIQSETAAEIVMDELFDPNRLLAEVAYTETDRYTLVIEKTETEGV